MLYNISLKLNVMQQEYTMEDYKKAAFIETPELKELYDQEKLNFFI